mgnify:CR=1 FL=1|tara:strand:+ start:2411 stop:3049 length:639 start_codon:yes stop_codon:yes gene_type:complete
MKLLAILLLSIAGMYLGYKLRKSSKDSNNERFSIYGGFTFLIALTGGILATSLFLLKGDSWTIDNKMMFRLIFISIIGFVFVFLGVRLARSGKRDGNKLGQIAGLTWVLVACFVSGMMITRTSKMNDGWTSERKSQVMSACEGLSDQGNSYNCPCYVREVIRSFNDPADYNKAMEDESSGKKAEFLGNMDEKCPCGVASFDESEVESVDLPF